MRSLYPDTKIGAYGCPVEVINLMYEVDFSSRIRGEDNHQHLPEFDRCIGLYLDK